MQALRSKEKSLISSLANALIRQPIGSHVCGGASGFSSSIPSARASLVKTVHPSRASHSGRSSGGPSSTSGRAFEQAGASGRPPSSSVSQNRFQGLRWWTSTRAGQNILLVGGSTICLSAYYQTLPPDAECYTVSARNRQAARDSKAAAAGGELGRSPLLSTALVIYETLATVCRGFYLWGVFLPFLLYTPVMLLAGGDAVRTHWLAILTRSLEAAGPAFIKWGQWSATRPDLFPVDVCRSLEKLHTQAPTHAFQDSKASVEAAFGAPLSELFLEFDRGPVASGSIAQVHRAVLRAGPLQAESRLPPGATVAVKVRHPGVTVMMQRDFTLMTWAAKAANAVPGLRELRLDESVRQFGTPLHEQLDLAQEAENLDRFNHNFRKWRDVSFPRPVFPLVAHDVLVETFEEGVLISQFVQSPGHRDNPQIAHIGMSLYLKMLLKDNLVHADLHPGNILVQAVDPASPWGQLAAAFGTHWNPKLTLLDAGMIAELAPEHQAGLVDFFQGMSVQDGAQVGRSILGMSEGTPKGEAAASAFVSDMAALFEDVDADTLRTRTAEVINNMMEQVRRHEVTLMSAVSTVVVTTMVLEGWATKLNPDVRIMEFIRSVLPSDWSKRMSAVVDSVMSTNSLAIAL